MHFSANGFFPRRRVRRGWWHGRVFILTMALASAPLFPAGKVRLSGEVNDPSGQPVGSARVEMTSLQAPATVQVVLTSREGRFSAELPGGWYQIVVSFPGFETWAEEVAVTTSQSLPVTLALASLSESVTVTATRHEDPTSEIPRVVSVTGKDEIQFYQPGSLTEILARFPGVSFTESGPFRRRPIIRGLDSNRVLVLVDGQRLNNARTSTVNSGIEPGLVDLHSVERVEVARGAGSVLYGSDALGGVINIITREPESVDRFKFSGRVLGEYHSASEGQRYHTTLGASAANWSFSVSGTAGRWDSYRNRAGSVVNSGADEDNLSASLSLAFSPSDRLRLEWARRRGSDIGVPGLGDADPFFAFFPFDNRDKVGIFYERRHLGKWAERLQANFFWQEQDRDFFNRVTSPGFSLSSSTLTNTRTIGYDLQATRPVRSHRLTYGTSFFRDTNGDLRQQTIFPGTPRSTVISRAPSVPDSSLEAMSAFLLDQWSVSDQLVLNLGVRGDWFHTSAEPTANFEGPLSEPRSDATLTGSAGATYHIGRGWSTFGRVGRAFREPNLFERFFFGRGSVGGFVVPNPDLRPETALDSEIGVRLQDRRVRLTVNYFHNHIRDLITSLPATFMGEPTFGGQPVSRNANIDQARIEGVEADLEVHWRARGEWILYSRHSYQRGTNLTMDEPLPLILPYSLSTGLRWFALAGRMVQEVEVQSIAGTTRVPLDASVLSGFTTYNWRGEFRLFDNFGFFAAQPGLPQFLGWSVENFTDKFYTHLFNSVPAEGLNFKIQIGWRF